MAATPARSTDGTEGAGLSTIDESISENVKRYRASDEGKQLIAWILAEFEKARQARSAVESNWRTHLRFYRGEHYGNPARNVKSAGTPQQQSKAARRKQINRIRSFVRGEHSKFVSQEPTVSVVPASSEDQDFRAASAGEQVYRSAISAGMLDVHYSQAAWWKVMTGNGFLKTYWDGGSIDPVSGEMGTIRYGSVTPFHLFVPDLREPSLEEQPFIFNAYTKTLAWARSRYNKELQDATAADVTLNAKITDQVTPEVQQYPESVTILEAWVKPGATKLLPQGGLLHIVGSCLVAITKQMPYMHGLYPYTHLQHLDTGGFYRDSPLEDLIDLQREYNEIRSDLARAGRVMGRPQLAMQKGSFTAAKYTNEIGLLLEFNPGMQPPTPLAMPEVPAYVQAQQDRILADFEDIAGSHAVSRGQAPGGGVTAGTAIAYLQESDDQYLTPQYRNDERAFEKIAKHTLELFVQYVPHPRKIKSIGADRAFDTGLLSGADIRNGTDIRVEKGSTISTSQVARRAEIKEMVGMGMLTPEQGLELLELGGSERIKETFDVARGKAQRENIKMKNLTVPEILSTTDEAVLAAKEGLSTEQLLVLAGPEVTDAIGPEPAPDMDPETGEVIPAPEQPPMPEAPEVAQMIEGQLREMAPPLIPADDFDVHELHIEIHNQYRMTQEYEQLPNEVKEQFEKHIAQHTEMAMQAQRSQFLNMIPSDGTDGAPGETGPQEMNFGPAPFETSQMEQMGQGQPMSPTRAQMLKEGVAPQTPGI